MKTLWILRFSSPPGSQMQQHAFSLTPHPHSADYHWTQSSCKKKVLRQLSQKTNIFGLKLWAVIGIGAGGVVIFVTVFILCLWCTRSRRPSKLSSRFRRDDSMTQQVELHRPRLPSEQQQQQQQNAAWHAAVVESDHSSLLPSQAAPRKESLSDESRSGSRSSCPKDSPTVAASAAAAGSDLGWGQWYTPQEIKLATNDFADNMLLGEGGYGVVYRGQLPDGTLVAVKNLRNNKGRAEREFRVEVEAIGRVRHKNLVRLLGYCAEGAQRMLVYEYVNNGNLEQWLHGPLAKSNPLTWEARMRIVLGTAKALAYLHEALEPKVVHRDIKSSNILVDTSWNAKVSDFGLAKLLGSGRSHVTTRVMGTFGYVAPEYCSTGMLNERSDVYSFGVLMMEVITGRDPMNLVEWLKQMVANKHSEDVADPNMKVKPTTRALKRALLVAVHCVDPDAQKRPNMGHVVHMLEADNFPF
ncbi:unnamed protein product [Sphagnum jensenii]|uniref:Protein kinase domain-containing protein n=1 Tax=Sphagnum jensenii TaxID=128206 RepID=A0ABP0XCB4_9BRYO